MSNTQSPLATTNAKRCAGPSSAGRLPSRKGGGHMPYRGR